MSLVCPAQHVVVMLIMVTAESSVFHKLCINKRWTIPAAICPMLLVVLLVDVLKTRWVAPSPLFAALSPAYVLCAL